MLKGGTKLLKGGTKLVKGGTKLLKGGTKLLKGGTKSLGWATGGGVVRPPPPPGYGPGITGPNFTFSNQRTIFLVSPFHSCMEAYHSIAVALWVVG